MPVIPLLRNRTGRALYEDQGWLRIAAARERQREEDASLAEVTLGSGYQSLRHFGTALREETGRAPRAWMRGGSRISA